MQQNITLLIGINTLSQAKFKVGDRVRVKTSGNIGEVKEVVEADYWYMMAPNSADYEYRIQFDDGNTSVIVEKVLELEQVAINKCTCGLKYARSGGKHSDWCDYNKFGMSYNDGTGD